MAAAKSRYSVSRQKACQPCSEAKARCDRGAICSRCSQRGLICTYANAIANVEYSSQSSLGPPGTIHAGSAGHGESPGLATRNGGSRSSFRQEHGQAFDFDPLDLQCPIKAKDIKNRWLNAYLPTPDQKAKHYPPNVMFFVGRILKSYTSVMVRGHGIPPFIHPSQVQTESITKPMSTCLSLVRICEKLLPGSEANATEVLQREMVNLAENYESYNEPTSLAAFQAYLIYAMILFFYLGAGSDAFFRQAVMSLQEMACSVATRGLVCTAELSQTRPRWEEWIIAEAKRRTLYVMYLLDNTLSTHYGLPTFLGEELRGLPVSSSKMLWQSTSRRDWETAYNLHLVDWTEQTLCVEELWPRPAFLTEQDTAERQRRVDHWLESVDEFGTMFYAVTCCTHGG